MRCASCRTHCLRQFVMCHDHRSNVRARATINSSSRRCRDDQSVTRTAFSHPKVGEPTKQCMLPICTTAKMIRESKENRGWGATCLCRLLFQLEQSFGDELLLPLLPPLQRQLCTVLLERGPDLPQALERQFREALPEKMGRVLLL